MIPLFKTFKKMLKIKTVMIIPAGVVSVINLN